MLAVGQVRTGQLLEDIVAKAGLSVQGSQSRCSVVREEKKEEGSLSDLAELDWCRSLRTLYSYLSDTIAWICWRASPSWGRSSVSRLFGSVSVDTVGICLVLRTSRSDKGRSILTFCRFEVW